MSNFYLKLFEVVYSDSDPNWLLFEVVNKSISTANSLIAKGIDEAKNLIDNAVQKMFEFEKSGVVIEADFKFRVQIQIPMSNSVLPDFSCSCFKCLSKI